MIEKQKLELESMLKFALSQGLSDIHLKSGKCPVYRQKGSLAFQKNAPPVSEDEILSLLMPVMNDHQKNIFAEKKEVDLGYHVPQVGRFRINLFRQKGSLCAVFRIIPAKIPTIEELNLPKVIEKIAMEKRGLILLTGAAGQGKSTTLAAMIDYINRNRSSHIITIEDPIEYYIEERKSLINQREVGSDTTSFLSALRAALRQDPDVIVVGEMRDRETIHTAMLAAETGHLVLSTLHTVDAKETINRILAVFPGEEQHQFRFQLAAILKAIISQRLIPRLDGKGRVPGCEILISTQRIQDMIREESKTADITKAIAEGYSQYGMQTFDQSITYLYAKKLISYDEALRQCSNPSDFILKVKGITRTGDSIKIEDFGIEGK